MAIPTFSMRQLLEAGVHFGHNTRRWDPRMEPYIYGVRNAIHIIDLQQTVPLLHQAMTAARDIASKGGRVLFVGTKRQAQEIVAECAERCGQYYVNHRWLGGMLTNWNTISNSIKRLKELEETVASDEAAMGLTKKELLNLTREREKLDKALGGIKNMGGQPDILVIIDTNKEDIAVAEAKKLGIPVIGVIDSNSNPNDITFPIPGNDDAIRAISLYCNLLVDSVLDGIQAEMTKKGVDIGASDVQISEGFEQSTDLSDEDHSRNSETKSAASPNEDEVNVKIDQKVESGEPEGEKVEETSDSDVEAQKNNLNNASIDKNVKQNKKHSTTKNDENKDMNASILNKNANTEANKNDEKKASAEKTPDEMKNNGEIVSE